MFQQNASRTSGNLEDEPEGTVVVVFGVVTVVVGGLVVVVEVVVVVVVVGVVVVGVVVVGVVGFEAVVAKRQQRTIIKC